MRPQPCSEHWQCPEKQILAENIFLGGERSWPISFKAGAALQVWSHGDIWMGENIARGSAVVQRGFGGGFCGFFLQNLQCLVHVCKAPALVEWLTAQFKCL